MEEALQQAQAKDGKERMAGVERLKTILEQSLVLSSSEVGNLVDASLVLLEDSNFRVSQSTLQALTSAAYLAGEHLKLHFNALLPAIVERLGDAKQSVREAARQLLLALMGTSSPSLIVERAGNFAWSHRNWRVREAFSRTVVSAINFYAATELPLQRMVLPSILHLLEDPNSSVRETAMLGLEEMYKRAPSQFKEELQRHQLRPQQLEDITSRFDKIDAQLPTSEVKANPIASSHHFSASAQSQNKPSMPTAITRRSSSRIKVPVSEGSIGSNSDIGEKAVDPIRVYSEKELTKEIEKAAGLLTPEQDWSVRIASMQKIEGLVSGGATEYACFLSLMKQLVGPLNVQLSDRRSSIVKQACHLLNMMSRDLRGDFEIFAESFIPVLFKLVVITVQVIAESADTCIKTMLKNCRVSRVLPKLMECAKHDRNAVLRARCCEYAVLVLEEWGDSQEIQRAADLYEELIKCCVGDAMGEVRSYARMCYRVFSRYWPERCRRVFVTFDVSVQKILNEEGSSLRHTSPFVRDRGGSGTQQPLRRSAHLMPGSTGSHQTATHSPPSYSSSSLVNIDRSSNALSGFGALNLSNSDKHDLVELSTERTLETALQAKQQASAIESMLRGLEVSDKVAGWVSANSVRANEVSNDATLPPAVRTSRVDQVGASYRRIHAASVANRVGVDPPSARDPPHPASAPAYNQSGRAAGEGSAASGYVRGNASAGSGNVGASLAGYHSEFSDTVNLLHSLGRDVDGAYLNAAGRDLGGSLATGLSAKRVPLDRRGPSSVNGSVGEGKGPKRVLKADYVEKGIMDSHDLPGFQRPLLRQSASGRSTGSSRSSVEENPVLAQFNAHVETQSYMDNSMSLNDVLAEGLSVNADWSARVSAFTFLKELLKKGSKGAQEINQNFGLVMKLFSAHLDDPHHKVAHAALATLADLVPACCKPFEMYLERILPHVFARLADGKDVIRQLGTTALEIVGHTYSIDSLLPALLRSLDQQRSPKAKVAVIEFAISSFARRALNGEASGGGSLLKLWLAKLGTLANEKNPKLKETAVTGIISVYSNFDSTTVFNFILGLSIEEQSVLRRSLKQYTPRIEVDLMTYLQNKSQRARSKFSSDGHHMTSQSARRKEVTDGDGVDGVDARPSRTGAWLSEAQRHKLAVDTKCDDDYSSSVDAQGTERWASGNSSPEVRQVSELEVKTRAKHDGESGRKADQKLSSPGSDHSAPFRIHQMMVDGVSSEPSNEKHEALQQFLFLLRGNDSAVGSQLCLQILNALLEALDDTELATRELALSVIIELLSRREQRLAVAESTETLLEKILMFTRDPDLKVSSAADRCLTIILTEFDPCCCFKVVVPLLVTEDEKTLVTYIGCLTKLVSRLSSEELTERLPSFLPALFDAFGNQSADVRKTVVFCLVEVYIALGTAFVPYLGSLSSTQLRLVTIYANRVSQARAEALSETAQQ